MRRKSTREKIGFLTTWNQACGLATFSRYLLAHFENGTYVVLAENTKECLTGPDERYVYRCWKRGDPNYGELERVVYRTNVKILHLYCQISFFEFPRFEDFLRRIKQCGVKVVATVHSIPTLHPKITLFLKNVDYTVVHCVQNQLEVIAHGAQRKSVGLLPLGVPVPLYLKGCSKQSIRQTLGIKSHEVLLSTFGFIQSRKGMDLLIKSVAKLRKKGIACRGLIAGNVRSDDPNGKKYLTLLKRLAAKKGVAKDIVFCERFLSEEELEKFMFASDIILLNYQTEHYETSGVCAQALGYNGLVVVSNSPAFSAYSEVVWKVSKGFPADLSLELLIERDELRAQMLSKVKQFNRSHGATRTVRQLHRIYDLLLSENGNVLPCKR